MMKVRDNNIVMAIFRKRPHFNITAITDYLNNPLFTNQIQFAP